MRPARPRAGATAAVALLLFLVARLFGTPALIVPAVALLAAAVLAPLSVRLASWRLSLERAPLSATAQEGEQLLVATGVSGPRLLRRGGELEPVVGAASVPSRSLPGSRIEVSVTAGRRGLCSVAPGVLRFGDPFGLCERRIVSPATELLVLPRVSRIERAELARLRELARERQHALAASSGEPDGLHAALEGAPAGRIHWPSYARTGTLLERRLHAAGDPLPLLVLDGAPGAQREDFDCAVRAAASLTVALARAGGCRVMLPGERRTRLLEPSLEGWQRFHAQLALLQAGARPARPPEGHRGTLLVWVSAAAGEPAPARGWPGPLVAVCPRDAAKGEALFEVAGCVVSARVPTRRATALPATP